MFMVKFAPIVLSIHIILYLKTPFYENFSHLYPPSPPRQHLSAFGLPPLPPSSAMVSFWLTPPPPFVSNSQHLPNSPPPLLADVICEQPLTSCW